METLEKKNVIILMYNNKVLKKILCTVYTSLILFKLNSNVFVSDRVSDVSNSRETYSS